MEAKRSGPVSSDNPQRLPLPSFKQPRRNSSPSIRTGNNEVLKNLKERGTLSDGDTNVNAADKGQENTDHAASSKDLSISQTINLTSNQIQGIEQPINSNATDAGNIPSSIVSSPTPDNGFKNFIKNIGKFFIYLGEAILKWFEKIIQYFKKNPKEDISTDENPQNIKDSPSPDTNSSSSDKDPSNSTTNVTGSNTNSQDKSQTSTKNSAHQDNNLDAISSTSDSSYTDGSSSNTDPSSSTTNVTGSDTDLQNKAQTPAKNNLPSAKTVPSNPQNTIYIEPKYKNTAPVRFFLEKNGMKIVECGGGGDCLIYSIMRQIKPYSEMSTKDFEDRRHQGMLEYRAQLTNLVLGNHPNNTNDIYSVLISDLTTLKNNLAEVRETSASENEELIQQIDNLTLYINRFTTNQNDAEARNNLTEQLGNFYAYISDLNEKNQKQNDLIQSVATCRLSISESALSDIGQYESNLLAREISTPGCSINLSAAGTSGICVGSTLVRITSRQLVVFTDTPSSTLKQNSKSAIIARIIGHNNQDETRYILYPDDLNNLPKDAIYLYYSGNTEYGHYQAIFPKEKNFSN